MQTQIPDGNGGWKTVEVQNVVEGQRVDAAKVDAAMQQAFINEAGELTEKIMAFDQIYISDRNLTKEHRVFAASLYCINLRETYPDGPEAFDNIAAAAAEYYDRETKKLEDK